MLGTTISRKFSCRLFDCSSGALSARPRRDDFAHAGVANLRAFSRSVFAPQYRLEIDPAGQLGRLPIALFTASSMLCG